MLSLLLPAPLKPSHHPLILSLGVMNLLGYLFPFSSSSSINVLTPQISGLRSFSAQIFFYFIKAEYFFFFLSYLLPPSESLSVPFPLPDLRYSQTPPGCERTSHLEQVGSVTALGRPVTAGTWEGWL